MSFKDQLGVIPWEQYEDFVRSSLSSLGAQIVSFTVHEKKKYNGSEGEYEIDVSVTFELFGGIRYLTLVECKSYKEANSVSRDQVMILNQKLQSIGAQKGIIFTTSDFQKGAIEFAQKHGIALIKMYSGEMVYMTKAFGNNNPQIPPSVPKLLGYLQTLNEDGDLIQSMVREEIKEAVLGFS